MAVKLSVVIACYDMQRELPRTLRSALPPLQRDVSPEEYEIVVVDNGSTVPIALPDDLQAPSSVRIHRIAREAALPSPVEALNTAVRELCAGEAIMMCIDGARMFSSHLVRRTLDALNRCPTAATFVSSRHIGHKKQMQAAKEGYDQDAEDRILAMVPWQQDLDALFGCSVLAGCHSAENPLLQNESNAIGLHRAL